MSHVLLDYLKVVRYLAMALMLAAMAMHDFSDTAINAKRALKTRCEIDRLTASFERRPVRKHLQNNITFADPKTINRIEASGRSDE